MSIANHDTGRNREYWAADQFLKMLRTYLGKEAPESNEDLFRQWLRDALLEFFRVPGATAFAPFDGDFRNQRELSENLEEFLCARLPELGKIGRRPAQSLVGDVLGSLVADMHSDQSALVVETTNGRRMISRWTVHLFRFWHKLARADSLEWLWRYQAEWKPDRHEYLAGEDGKSLPAVLYGSLVDFSASDKLGAKVTVAMYDWACDHPTEEIPGLTQVNLLCRRLVAIPRRDEAAARQCALDVMQRFVTGNEEGDSLASAFLLRIGASPSYMRWFVQARNDIAQSLQRIELGGRPEWMSEKEAIAFFDSLDWGQETDVWAFERTPPTGPRPIDMRRVDPGLYVGLPQAAEI